MAHAAQRHGAAEPADVNSKLKNVVYVSPEVAYIGDSYEHEPGTGTIHVTGGGIVVQRFASSDPTLHGADAAGGALIECKCGSTAGGTCDTFIFGGTATCSNGTCTRCGWATTIPGGGLAPPKKLLAQ
jgi:hypothetical protein